MNTYAGKLSYLNHGIQVLLRSYEQIRKHLLKLSNKKLVHQNDISYLIKQANNIPKRKQRQIMQNMEIQLGKQLKNMYTNYMKNKIKIRKCQLYSHSLCYFNLILSKIKDFLPTQGSFVANNQNLIRWKLFLSQVFQLKQILLSWLKGQNHNSNHKHPSIGKDQNSAKISFIYSNSQTRPSTAVGSFSVSQRQQQNDKDQPKQQKKKPYLISKSKLQRCSTANLTKKNHSKQQYKMATRCPSAKLVIKSDKKIDTSSGNNFFQRVNTKKLTRKATLNIRQNMDEKQLSFDNNLIILNSAISISKQNTRIRQNQDLVIKQEVQNNEEQLNEDVKKQQVYFTSKQTFINQRRSSLRKVKNITNHSVKSYFGKNSDNALDSEVINPSLIQNFKQNQILLNKSYLQRTQRMTPRKNKHPKLQTDRFNKMVVYQTQVQSARKRDDQVTAAKLAQNDKKLKLSSVKNKNNQIEKQSNQINLRPKKTNRRNGQLNNPNLLQILNQVEKQRDEQDKLQFQEKVRQKTILFNLNLIKQIQDEKDKDDFSLQDLNSYRFQSQKYSAVKYYQYLSQFKKQQNKNAEGSSLYGESIFFNYQDALREQQGRNLQRYIKQLRKKQQVLGQIFQIRNQESNSKYGSYMLRQRNIAFQNDNQWLNTYKKHQQDFNLFQKQLHNSQQNQLYI